MVSKDSRISGMQAQHSSKTNNGGRIDLPNTWQIPLMGLKF